jgi:hypothetical protein
MTEARFSYTRKVEGELLTVRGDTGQEFLENFMWLYGDDEANRFFTFTRNTPGSVTDILGNDNGPTLEQAALELARNTLGLVPPPVSDGKVAQSIASGVAPPTGFDAPDPSDARNEKGAPGLSAAQQAALAAIKAG